MSRELNNFSEEDLQDRYYKVMQKEHLKRFLAKVGMFVFIGISIYVGNKADSFWIGIGTFFIIIILYLLLAFVIETIRRYIF